MDVYAESLIFHKVKRKWYQLKDKTIVIGSYVIIGDVTRIVLQSCSFTVKTDAINPLEMILM